MVRADFCERSVWDQVECQQTTTVIVLFVKPIVIIRPLCSLVVRQPWVMIVVTLQGSIAPVDQVTIPISWSTSLGLMSLYTVVDRLRLSLDLHLQLNHVGMNLCLTGRAMICEKVRLRQVCLMNRTFWYEISDVDRCRESRLGSWCWSLGWGSGLD